MTGKSKRDICYSSVVPTHPKRYNNTWPLKFCSAASQRMIW
jgi:hypothetical protein